MSEISPTNELKNIAELIVSLPSNKLLDRCQTEAQKNEWHNYKNNQLLLAKAWEAEFILGQGDPINDALVKQEISKQRHKMLQEKVQLYKCHWELIKPQICMWKIGVIGFTNISANLRINSCLLDGIIRFLMDW